MLADAIAQIPAAHRRHLLIRDDSAAGTHTVLDWLADQNTRRRTVEYSIGWSIGEAERTAITALPASAWTPALAADGGVREKAEVAELTGLLTLTGWPDGMRVIVRRERPHPGAQLSLFEERDGWRYTAFVTNTRVGALQWLEARHRAHARVEDRIRCAKDTGLRRLPSREFAVNQAWCTAAAIAADLIAWLQLHALDGDLATAEPTAAHRRPPHPRPTPPLATHPRNLALGPSTIRRVHPDHGDPRTRLTPASPQPHDRRPRPPPRQPARQHAQTAATINANRSKRSGKPGSRHRRIIEVRRHRRATATGDAVRRPESAWRISPRVETYEKCLGAGGEGMVAVALGVGAEDGQELD